MSNGATQRPEARSRPEIVYSEEQQRALSLWVVMHRAFTSLNQVAEADIRARGFNPTEWGVLEFLYHKGAQPLVKVGEKNLVSSGSVTYVVDKLEAKGLLKRAPCATDRRVIYAVLTEEGEALMRREFPAHAETIRQMFSHLDAETQDQLRSLLKKAGKAPSASKAPS